MLEKIPKLKEKAKLEILILYFAFCDSRTPWYTKVMAICLLAYAFSPIDLIPDFIPIVGYLDDAIIIPIGIFLIKQTVPSSVLDDSRKSALAISPETKKRIGLVAVPVIVIIWIAVISFAIRVIMNFLK